MDQQSSVAQARVNNAYAFDDTFNWFIPGSKGDHNVRAGIQYEYVNVFSTAQDNWNGTFLFRTNSDYNPNDFRTYPERLQIRVPGASEYTQKQDFFAAFLQDKWRMGKHLTLSLGLRYDLEKLPLPENDNPQLRQPGRLSPGQEQHRAARRLRLRRQGRRQDRSCAAATAASTTRRTSS